MIKLKGVKAKGLTVFPSSIKTVQPCKHKYGATSIWSHCTDTIQAHYANAEINAFKHNMQLTAFITPFYTYSIPSEVIKGIYETGRVGYGIYFQTEYWKNPITGINEAIPDYYGTTWTSAAYNAGIITQDKVGTSKTANYPNHGQQLFDISGGKYGYDFVNDVAGEIDVLSPLIEHYVNWFKDSFGRYPSCGSYGYGRTQPSYALYNYFLGFRTSGSDGSYGYLFNHLQSMIRTSSSRVHDDRPDLTRAEVRAIAEGYLQNSITNEGWFTDFVHWHWTDGNTELADFYASQRTAIGSNNVKTVDYATAIEYKFLRDMVRRISMYESDGKIILVVDLKNNDELKLDCIETSLSVPIDLTGTILEGKEIKGFGDAGIQKISANNFIVEIPYSQKDGFESVHLQETIYPEYLDFALPSISSVTKDGNTIHVLTDKPANVVLFSVPTGGELYSASVLKRSNIMSTEHYMDVTGTDFSGLDVYVGIITSTKQSILSAKYNF